jgi:hypothetical protein
MNLTTAAQADTSQENNWHPEAFTSGFPVILSQLHETSDLHAAMSDLLGAIESEDSPLGND